MSGELRRAMEHEVNAVSKHPADGKHIKPAGGFALIEEIVPEDSVIHLITKEKNDMRARRWKLVEAGSSYYPVQGVEVAWKFTNGVEVVIAMQSEAITFAGSPKRAVTRMSNVIGAVMPES